MGRLLKPEKAMSALEFATTQATLFSRPKFMMDSAGFSEAMGTPGPTALGAMNNFSGSVLS